MNIDAFGPVEIRIECTFDRKADTELFKIKLINENNKLNSQLEKLNKLINASNVRFSIDEYCEIYDKIKEIDKGIESNNSILLDIKNGWLV